MLVQKVCSGGAHRHTNHWMVFLQHSIISAVHGFKRDYSDDDLMKETKQLLLPTQVLSYITHGCYPYRSRRRRFGDSDGKKDI